MAAFVRQPAEGWDTIPGTRWFRADLHLHTVDDLPGKRAKFPAGLHGAADDPAVLRAYARAFLQAAIVAQIGVLGVTPHAVRCAEAAESSAVWTIVDTWNTESDDDGVPFRNKIFAVFPGFEPSFRDGKDGLHLQILFDPEIGRERFLKAFELMMGGVNAYEGGALQISSKSAEDALAELRSFADRTFGGSADFAVLAPHAESDKGLFKALAAQVLKLFDHGQLTAIELGDNTLPEEIRKKKGQWFEEGLARYRLALYHSSDAYKLSPSSENDFAIGNRCTWLKLATPTIEGLRQAFLAHESRLRIAYVKDSQGKLTPSPHAPSANAAGRTWLKQLTVKGPAAFFGGQGAGSQFVFSPDLTCIIGSSMSGKSTLLDGLRLALHARLPARAELRQQVEARAQNRFSAGRPDLEMQWQPHAPANDRLPLFFTQSELQTLAEGSRALEEDVIARLLPGSSARFEELRATIRRLDGELRDLVPKLKASSDGVARAAQQMSEAEAAETRLAALKDVGYDRWQAENRAVAKLDGLLKQVADEGKRFAETLDVMGEWGPALESVGDDAELVELASAAREAHCSAKAAVDRLRALWPKLRERLRRSQEASERVRHDLEKAVAAQGTPADGLLELRQLADRAKYLESYRAAHLKLSADYASLLATFTATSDDRAVQRAEYRSAMREVAAAVQRQHEGRIEMDLVEDCLLYTSPSPRDRTRSRMPSSA